MSELPELPPLTRRTRSVPPGGLEAVMRGGRRRRAQFLGAAGGGTGALVLVLALVAAGPSPRDESLQFGGDPTPTASAEASPEPSTAADPTPVPEDSPAPGGAPQSEPPSSPEAEPAQQDEPRASAPADEPAPAGPAEPQPEPYVEEPVEYAAPQECRNQSSQVGPISQASGGSCGSYSTDERRTRRGGQVTVGIFLCTPYGERPATIGYATGQEHEVLVLQGSRVVYRFSATVAYPQGKHERTLGEGRCLRWTGTWDTTYTDGGDVPAGSYEMRVSTEHDTVNGESVTPEQREVIAVPVRVE